MLFFLQRVIQKYLLVIKKSKGKTQLLTSEIKMLLTTGVMTKWVLVSIKCNKTEIVYIVIFSPKM